MTTKWSGAAVAAGFLLGAGAALAVMLALRRRASAQAGTKPSMAGRILAKIPLRVKLAAAAGAVRGGGGAALREASRRLARAARERRRRSAAHPAAEPRSARRTPSFDRF